MSDDAPDTLTPAAQALCDYATGLVGLTQADERYQQLVAPKDAPARAAEVARTTSGCMTSRAGAESDVFQIEPWGPFVGDRVQVVLEQRAKELDGSGGTPWTPGGGFRVCTQDASPVVADGIWYGAANGHPEHVDLCVLSTTPTLVPGGYRAALLATVVAGGQRVTDEDVKAGLFDRALLGAECIKQLERVLVWDGHAWIDHGTLRHVVGVLGPADWYATRYGLR